MKKDFWDRFASKLKSVDEAPEPLGSALRAALRPEDSVRLLLFGPAAKSVHKTSPATLLAVLDREWVLVSGTQETPPQVVRADFAETLLVELTVILLYGRLKLDYATAGVVRSVVIEFNTVMDRSYKEAVRLMLDGMEGIRDAKPIENGSLNGLLQGIPMKFCSAVDEFRPLSQRVLGVQHWPAVTDGRWRWFERELAPEAMLVLTERELILISEERSWSWLWIGRVNKYGNVLTYCPLSRLERFGMQDRESLCALELELRAQNGSVNFHIDFPREQEPAVARFMGREHLQNFDVSWGHEPGSSTAVRAAAQRDRTVLWCVRKDDSLERLVPVSDMRVDW